MKSLRLFTTTLVALVLGFTGVTQTTFNYTGALQTYTVPAGVTSVLVQTWGAQGVTGLGASGGVGGLGGYSEGVLNVIPGQILNVYVGGQNGYNGGGTGGTIGAGNGGGASDVRVGGTALGDRVIVAGGGGGGGSTGCVSTWAGGAGGIGGGGAAGNGVDSPNGGGGFGGTVGAGGAAGIGCAGFLGSPGQANGTGGNGQGCCCSTTPGGGGGGGGYLNGGGGGGGSAGTTGCSGNDKGGGGGGAGGSSWTGSLSNPVITDGIQNGDGMIVISIACVATTLTPDAVSLADSTGECSITIINAPTATNDCGYNVSGVPDVSFPVTAIGTTIITWTYDDGSGNITTQSQNIIVVDSVAPVPDSVGLPDIYGQCDVNSLIPPTATDLCSGTIGGVSDAVLPITTPGTTVITWEYDDGNGNITTQTQNVINPTIDTGISQFGSMLSADALGSTYQWLYCDSAYAQISGEMNQYYFITSSGSYAVEISQDNCVDTTVCVLVDLTGLDELYNSIQLYPNPASSEFTISYDGILNEVAIIDLSGKVLLQKTDFSDNKIDVHNLAKGNYLVKVFVDGGLIVKELVIMH